ncbi:MAG: rubrerythrin family protein [bacterium]
MTTQKNLQDAFAGESQANRKYLAFAMKAEQDGYPQVARLFRAAAEAETIHAHAHLRAMEGIHGTAENLQAAVEGERYEYQEMYPIFLSEAREEGHKRAAQSFEFACAAEEVHFNLYRQALRAVQAGQDLESQVIYLCPVCGTLEIGRAPDKCPICNTAGEKFIAIS